MRVSLHYSMATGSAFQIPALNKFHLARPIPGGLTAPQHTSVVYCMSEYLLLVGERVFFFSFEFPSWLGWLLPGQITLKNPTSTEYGLGLLGCLFDVCVPVRHVHAFYLCAVTCTFYNVQDKFYSGLFGRYSTNSEPYLTVVASAQETVKCYGVVLFVSLCL